MFLRRQYLCMMNLAAFFERMHKQQPYRKYRPEVSVSSNSREWWNYCITGVLEVDVRTYNRMWSWNNMKKHRATCKHYQECYKEKLIHKTPPKELVALLEKLEKSMNVVSITIFRQLAENDYLRMRKKKKEE